ncbi:MAG TPA: EthD domain-containing protein [Caulobacteraceae bacterium]|jgi:uncharacterized protein (TIGR02118 family)|nr:EthD domain-containing protein [Caulobacteraceae bacterium]
MIRMTVALTRLPSLGRAEFQAYWIDRHAPLVASLAEILGIQGYIQLHTAVDDDRAPWLAPYDGLAEIRYASRADFDARMSSPAGQAAGRVLRDDERRFIDRSRSPRWWGVERTIL